MLLVVMLTVAVSLPFTESGTRFLIGRANQIEGVDIRLGDGVLAGQLRLEQVSIVTGGLRLELEDMESVLQSGCLWRSTVCLSQLNASSLKISASGSTRDDPDEEKAGDNVFLHWPIRVEAPAIRLGQLLVEWPGGHWSQGGLEADVTLFDATVQIAQGRLNNAGLLIEASADDQPPGSVELPEIFLPLNLVVGELSVDGLEVAIGEVVEPVERVDITGHWRGYELNLESVVIDSARAELSLAGELAFRERWPLTISAGVTAFALGEFGEHEATASIEGDLSHTNLKLQTMGTFNGSLDADLELLAPGVPFSGGVILTPAEGGTLADLIQLPEFASDVALLSPVVAQVQGDISRQVFALETELGGAGYEQLQFRAEGAHEDRSVLLDSVSLHDAASQSDLHASGSVNYGEDLGVSAVFESDGLALPQLNDALTGRLTGGGSLEFKMAQSWQLSVSALALEGEVNQLPAQLSGQLRLSQGGRFGSTHLQGAVNGAELRLEGEPAGGALLELRMDEFARWHKEARGGLQLVVRRAVGSDRFDLEGQLQQPAFGSLSAERGELSGYFDPGLERFNLALDLQYPGAAGVELSALHFNAMGSLKSHRLVVRGVGDMQGDLSLAGELRNGDWQGELAPSQLDTRHGQWTLAEPVSLGWNSADGVVSLQAHCWRHPQLALCVDDSRLGAEGELELTALGDLAAFNGLVPPDLRLQGVLDAAIRASWSDSEALKFDGRAISKDASVTRHFGLGDDITIGWDSLSASMLANDEGMAFGAAMQRGGSPVLQLELSLPPKRDDDMQGQLLLDKLQLESMAPWAPELSRLEGELNGKLAISGKLASPVFTGPVSLSGGNLALEGNPTEVTDLELSLLMRGDAADITGRALLGGGELKVDGVMQLLPDMQLKLEVSGSQHQILVPPSAELLVSEDLVITAVPGLVDVRGEIRVAEGVLRHEQLPAGSVALSPDVIEVDLTGQPIVEEGRWDVRSDVWIRLRDRFRVAGDNLNATVGGDLHLRQEPGKPLQLFGNLNIIGGELQAYRQQLVIRRGTVAFSGAPDNPELDVRAERELREQGITVGASLQGSLEAPRLDVYSDPPMSQGEAMSYLVRGRGLDSGAGADGTSLALAMGANVVNESGILAPVNRLPGINNVSFGSTGTDDDTAATVSGYLGERIYLSYGIGLYEPINVLTARLYLQSRLWVEVVSRLENSVDIYYSFDIE